MSHIVTTSYNLGMSFTSHIDSHTLQMESSVPGNDSPGAPSPKKLMLASLTGCTGVDIVNILEKMKVSFSDFTITAIADLSASHPQIYNRVKLEYRIKIDEAERPRMERAMKLSEEKYCGVMAMFKAFATIETHLEIVPQ